MLTPRQRRRRRQRLVPSGAPLERAERVLPYPKFMQSYKLDRGSMLRLAPLPQLSYELDQGSRDVIEQPGWASEMLSRIAKLECVEPHVAPADVLHAAAIIQRKFRVFRFRRQMTEKWNVLCSFRYMVEHYAALTIQTALIRPYLATREVARIRHAWRTHNAIQIQRLARKHLAINIAKRMHAKSLMQLIKEIIPGGKMSRLLLATEGHHHQLSAFSPTEAAKLGKLLRTLLDQPRDMQWSRILAGRSFIYYIANRNKMRQKILAERRRVALQLGTHALEVTKAERLVRTETGKKAMALRSEIEKSRRSAARRAEREKRERKWREDERVAQKHRLRKQLQDAAAAVSSVCLDQALYLVGTLVNDSKKRTNRRLSISPKDLKSKAPNEMTYLELAREIVTLKAIN